MRRSEVTALMFGAWLALFAYAVSLIGCAFYAGFGR